jgi:ribosomal protein S18 acetylase RimI-like enzyme
VEGCRAADADDLPRIAELATAMRAELARERGGALWLAREARDEPLDASYRTLLERDDAWLLVGTLDDVVVGFGAATTEALADGSVLGVVSDLYVEPAAREVGVGECLANALVDRCAQRDCIGVDATALPGMRASKNFFETHGFVARALVMHKPLSG